MSNQIKQGWANPSPMNANAKFHYIKDGRSLCGKWGWVGKDSDLDDSNDDHPDNCITCKRKKMILK